MTDATPRPPHRSVYRRWGARALFEGVLIVFSISLALAISAWVNDLQTAARVREARTYFIEELQANRAALLEDSIIPHHQRLLDALEDVPMENPLSQDAAMPTINTVFRTGVHSAALRDVAWSTFSNTDLLAHMPSEEVFALNDAYEAQARIDQLQEAFYPVLVQIPAQLTTAQDLRGPLISIRLHLADVVVAEQTAVARYDAALLALGVAPPAEEPAAAAEQ
ncbi:MAG: hypothetical protein ABL871_19745 [Terricaulis sp.]